MAISDDWSVDFVGKVISHIDGTLDYDTGAGTQPAVGDVIRGNTNGALVKILARSGTAASGTFTVTDTNGRFADNEPLTNCDYVDFDNVQNNGFSVGDTVTGVSSGRTGVIRKIEYNLTATGGFGRIWSEQFGVGSWTDNENIQVGGTTRALANGTGVDNSGTWTGALVNEATGTVTPPANSDSIIINYDGGLELIPRFATIQDTDDATPNQTAIVQQTYGVLATGSLRLIDTTGAAWLDNDVIYVQKIPYDTLQSGQRFKVSDKIVTKTTPGGAVNATGKIIAIEVLTATTGKLTLMNQTGTFTNDDRIEVRTTTDTWVALINAPLASDFQDNVADVFVNASQPAEISTQLATQGGIYNGGSLNIIRDSNALYTYLQDTFDELGALDDDVPMTAQVALQQFTLVNGWKIPDLSFRFLESGSIQDETLDNIWTNYQTLGTVEGIGDTVYAATTPLPQFYIEQSGSVISAWWYYGHIDILVKVKTNTNPTSTVNADGVLINSGTVTIFNRNYTDTYDHFQTTTIAGVAPIPLATSDDLNNQTGTHSFTFTGTGGQLLLVGEEIVSTTPNDPTKRGIITSIATSDSQATGTIEYVFTGSTQFANTDVITGQTSGFNKTINSAISTLVAGYTSRIIISTVDYTVAGSLTSGTFVGGETVTSSGNGSAIFMHLNAAQNLIYIGNATSNFSIANTQTLTGAISGAIYTASAGQSDSSVVPKNIGDGFGEQNYNAVIFLNRDNQANGDTLARMYEWVKYRTRIYETTGEPEYNLLGGPGTAAGLQGRLYITLNSNYALVKASPLGTFAGGTFFGARGVFVQDMASSDIRNYQLIDAGGAVRNPPSLQTLQVNGLVSGDRVAVFRLTGAGGTILLNEYALDTETGDHNGTGDSVVQVDTALTADTPSTKGNSTFTGVVRLYNATTQLYDSYDYSDVTYAIPGRFTGISPVLTQNYIVGDNVYVPLLQREADATSESVNIEYISNIPILTRVRRKGILPFEVESTFGASGATVAAIRSFDSIVD